MTDGIDFSLLGKPADPVGDYANAFRAGRHLAAEQAAPEGPAGVNAMTGQAGAPAQIAAMSDEQRTQGARRTEILGAVGQSLTALPYPARAGVIAHMAPALIAHGLPAAALEGFDPTDENLGQAMAQMAALRRLFEG